jgi:hypothetical protein
LQNITLDTLKLDWVTSTERYHDDDYIFRLQRLVADGLPSKWLQFKGNVSFDGHIFQGRYLSHRGHDNLACYRISSWPANCFWHHLAGCHATRLDLALDSRSVPGFYDAFDAHRRTLKGVNSAFSIVQSGKRKGFTFNFGSRKSDVFLRVYDKSEESHLDVPGIVRLEIELKGRTASKVFDMVCEYGTDSELLQSTFVGFIDKKLKGFPLADYFPWFGGFVGTRVDVPLPVALPEERIRKYFSYLVDLSMEYPLVFREELKYFHVCLASQTDITEREETDE